MANLTTRIFVLILFLSSLTSIDCNAQSSKSFMLGLGFDLFKTDNDGFAEKSQIGLEGNYFVVSNFAVTAGIDFWSRRSDRFI